MALLKAFHIENMWTHSAIPERHSLKVPFTCNINKHIPFTHTHSLSTGVKHMLEAFEKYKKDQNGNLKIIEK